MASTTVYLITIIMLGALTSLSVTANNLQNVLFDGNYEFIDLTHSFNNETVNWPGVKKFQFTKKTERLDGDESWYAGYEFATGEHAGTHLDAPYHFYQTGKVVGDLSLDKLIVPLVVIDVSSKVNGNPDYVLPIEDLGDLLQDLKKNCLVLFKFGWSQYYHDYQKYFGLNGTKMNFPGLSNEVAELITTKHKNVVGVGVDVASVDPGASTKFTVHKTFAKAGLYNLENVNLYRNICAKKCTALVMPMKIEQGTGAPSRVIAICPKKAIKSN